MYHLDSVVSLVLECVGVILFFFCICLRGGEAD